MSLAAIRERMNSGGDEDKALIRFVAEELANNIVQKTVSLAKISGDAVKSTYGALSQFSSPKAIVKGGMTVGKAVGRKVGNLADKMELTPKDILMDSMDNSPLARWLFSKMDFGKMFKRDEHPDFDEPEPVKEKPKKPQNHDNDVLKQIEANTGEIQKDAKLIIRQLGKPQGIPTNKSTVFTPLEGKISNIAPMLEPEIKPVFSPLTEKQNGVSSPLANPKKAFETVRGGLTGIGARANSFGSLVRNAQGWAAGREQPKNDSKIEIISDKFEVMQSQNEQKKISDGIQEDKVATKLDENKTEISAVKTKLSDIFDFMKKKFGEGDKSETVFDKAKGMFDDFFGRDGKRGGRSRGGRGGRPTPKRGGGKISKAGDLFKRGAGKVGDVAKRVPSMAKNLGSRAVGMGGQALSRGGSLVGRAAPLLARAAPALGMGAAGGGGLAAMAAPALATGAAALFGGTGLYSAYKFAKGEDASNWISNLVDKGTQKVTGNKNASLGTMLSDWVHKDEIEKANAPVVVPKKQNIMPTGKVADNSTNIIEKQTVEANKKSVERSQTPVVVQAPTQQAAPNPKTTTGKTGGEIAPVVTRPTDSTLRRIGETMLIPSFR